MRFIQSYKVGLVIKIEREDEKSRVFNFPTNTNYLPLIKTNN